MYSTQVQFSDLNSTRTKSRIILSTISENHSISKVCKSSEEKLSVMPKNQKLHAFVASLSGRDII